jgi:glucosylceramidase
VDVVQTSRNAGDGGVSENCVDKASLVPVPAGASTRTVITVDFDAPRQTIIGFGSSMTECTSATLQVSSTGPEMYNALFGEDENNYEVMRITMGSSDFSHTEGTYADGGSLDSFSIDQDREYVIPALLAANSAAGHEVKYLASPWTAPGWMKNSGQLMGGQAQDGDGWEMKCEQLDGLAEKLGAEGWDPFAVYSRDNKEFRCLRRRL